MCKHGARYCIFSIYLSTLTLCLHDDTQEGDERRGAKLKGVRYATVQAESWDVVALWS